MKKSTITLGLIPTLFFVPGFVYGDTKPQLEHIATLKITYTENWYSYNFVVCASDDHIHPFDVVLTSDLETKHMSYDKSIQSGNCVSFGMMIHATSPELISVNPIWD